MIKNRKNRTEVLEVVKKVCRADMCEPDESLVPWRKKRCSVKSPDSVRILFFRSIARESRYCD
mgnify:CR=1 FL=1